MVVSHPNNNGTINERHVVLVRLAQCTNRSTRDMFLWVKVDHRRAKQMD